MSDPLPPGALERLQGLSEWVEFTSARQMAEAVGALIGCHEHRVIVLARDEPSLIMSKAAIECLAHHFAEYRLMVVDDD